MNLKEIKEMIQLMNENNLTELEIEKEDMKIRLKKGASGTIEAVSSEPSSVPAQPVREKVAPPPPPPPAPPKTIIYSPMVGTFYAQPAPDAPPFVQPGTQIEVGKVVCIIEAMKLMNEIKAEVRGKIAEVLVNNGDPVEFGQPLFSLE